MSSLVGFDRSRPTGPEDYDVSLDSKFKKALRLVARLESGELFPTSDEFRALHSDCLRAVVECIERVEQLGIFSPNETLDDIQTPDLRYLNLNFFLAKVLEKTPINPSKMSLQARVDVLNLSVHRYLEFLYDIVGLRLTLKPETGPRAPFVPPVPVEVLLPEGKYGMSDLQKLDTRTHGRRVKQENTLRLRAAEKSLSQSRTKAAPQDEEAVRQVESDRLVLHWFASWDSLFGIIAELEMLAASAAALDVPESSRNNYKAYVPASRLPDVIAHCSSGGGGGDTFNDLRMRMDRKADDDMSRRVEAATESLSGPGKLVGSDGKVRRPFVIMPQGDVKRTRLAQSVFGTGQRMPTVTVEELVERELANQVKPQVPDSELNKFAAEDNDDAADILTTKARRWDDFKDANPRGSGNTLNLG